MTIPANTKGRIDKELVYHDEYRHYWNMTCNIGGKFYQMIKKNKQINLNSRDYESYPEFRLHKINNEVRLTTISNSGNCLVRLMSEDSEWKANDVFDALF